MTDAALEWNLIHRINVGDALTRAAAYQPQREAVVDGPRRFTYGQLDEWVNRTAAGLAARGFVKGDTLAIFSGNGTEFLVAYFACAKSGIVVVPINLGWRESEMAYVLRHAKVRGLLVESQLLERADLALTALAELGTDGTRHEVADVFVAPGTSEARKGALAGRTYHDFAALGEGQTSAPPEVIVGDRDPISYMYTSGTTSAPKGVVSSHLAVHLESLTGAFDMEMRRSDRVLCMMPLFHTAQINAICTPTVVAGATMVLLRAFDADTVLDLTQREGLTVTFALPMMYRALVAAQTARNRDVATLRLAIYAMAPMPNHELKAAMETFGCGFALLFGQTEMCPISTIFRPEHQLSHMGAVGTPGINVQVAIMAEDGTLVPRGERGEIVYRSPHVTERYLDDEKATAAAFKYGWFHSGDTGHLGEDGMLWFGDRYKDVIKSGGENVASLEVEKLVYEVAPSIAQAVVIGLPHDRWGEAITVVAVAHPGQRIEADTVIGALKGRLSPFKVPKAVIVVEAMPMTSTGKIQKNVLRQNHAAHYAGKS